MTDDDPFVEAIKQDYTKVDLPANERAMLDYAVKLTIAPSSVGRKTSKSCAHTASTIAISSTSST